MLLRKVFLKAFNLVFKPSKNEEITLPHEFIFVLCRKFIGAIMSERFAESGGFGKNIKRGDGHIGGGGGSNLLHYDIERLKRGSLKL